MLRKKNYKFEMHMVPRIQWWNKTIEKLQELIHDQIVINKRTCKDKSNRFNFDYKRKSTTTKQLETTFHFKRWPWKSVTSITYLTNSTKNIWTQSKCFKGEQIINTPIYVKFVSWRQWKICVANTKGWHTRRTIFCKFIFVCARPPWWTPFVWTTCNRTIIQCKKCKCEFCELRWCT